MISVVIAALLLQIAQIVRYRLVAPHGAEAQDGPKARASYHAMMAPDPARRSGRGFFVVAPAVTSRCLGKDVKTGEICEAPHKNAMCLLDLLYVGGRNRIEDDNGFLVQRFDLPRLDNKKKIRNKTILSPAFARHEPSCRASSFADLQKSPA